MSAVVDDRCPRCGGDFHCGANDAAACACTTIALNATMLAALRQRFTGCLCLGCLREIQREGLSVADPPSA